MGILFVVIAIVALILAITGGLVHALGFPLWVGIVLLVLAVIAFMIRSITGPRVSRSDLASIAGSFLNERGGLAAV